MTFLNVWMADFFLGGGKIINTFKMTKHLKKSYQLEIIWWLSDKTSFATSHSWYHSYNIKYNVVFPFQHYTFYEFFMCKFGILDKKKNMSRIHTFYFYNCFVVAMALKEILKYSKFLLPVVCGSFKKPVLPF